MNSYGKLPVSLDNVSLPQELPPIVLIAFTRPDLLQEVLKAIGQQSLLPSKIIAFVDGARTSADTPLIEDCVLLLKEFSSIVPVHIVERAENLGCDQNVISGLTEALSQHDSVVYMEDDTVPNPYFYDRLCRLLVAYRGCKQVCSVSAYATYPPDLEIPDNIDFIVSNRVFCWGMGLWADRWQEIDLANRSGQYNPFSNFYQIPATSQTKMTIINQFWLEKNMKTDWAITFTIAALALKKVHIVPVKSLTWNIGFGHPQSKTYKGKEQDWVNAKYEEKFCPNQLPKSLDLLPQLGRSLTIPELIDHFAENKNIWLSPAAFFHLFQQANSLRDKTETLGFFIKRLPKVLQRWRNKLPV